MCGPELGSVGAEHLIMSIPALGPMRTGLSPSALIGLSPCRTLDYQDCLRTAVGRRWNQL